MNIVPFSQGKEAATAGQWLEGLVEQEARSRGFHVVDYASEKDNGDLFSPALLIRRVPYRSIYGSDKCRGEFVLQLAGRRVRIECRCQESGGSIDEKFPYFFLNARDAMEEKEVILLLHGEGARTEATHWLREQCRKTTVKTIHVFTLTEFRQWLKRLVAGNA